MGSGVSERPAWLAAWVVFALLLVLAPSPAAAGPTPEEYISHVGSDAKIISTYLPYGL